MPAKIDETTRGAMVIYRALDYTKEEIADELGITRQTVSRHLDEIREEAIEAEQPSDVVLGYVQRGRVKTDAPVGDTATRSRSGTASNLGAGTSGFVGESAVAGNKQQTQETSTSKATKEAIADLLMQFLEDNTEGSEDSAGETPDEMEE